VLNVWVPVYVVSQILLPLSARIMAINTVRHNVTQKHEDMLL